MGVVRYVKKKSKRSFLEYLQLDARYTEHSVSGVSRWIRTATACNRVERKKGETGTDSRSRITAPPLKLTLRFREMRDSVYLEG